MKILYVDNRDYHHNRDIHVDFFAYIGKQTKIRIFPYGKYLRRFFKDAAVPVGDANKELRIIVDRFKPDCIITYNPNGSSYELGLDNVNSYRWCQDFLAGTAVPKLHISTDYCRSGFKPEQGVWFEELNYAAALFRHKVSLKHPIDVPAYWFPFSVDATLYQKHSIPNVKVKNKKVGFVGAAHNSSKSLYANRIAAIDFLQKQNKLALTKVIDNKKFERKMLFGKEYIDFLSHNLFNLTCGGTCNFMTAKYFQIPAAYSMLVCTDTEGLEIFPEDTYIKYDKDGLSDLNYQIDYFSRNLREAKFKISKLNRYVLDNHSHEKRLSDLLSLIKMFV